jgi:hypothetical protein
LRRVWNTGNVQHQQKPLIQAICSKVNIEIARSSPLASFMSPVLGLPAWGVTQGHGSFLTLDFGSPQRVIIERDEAKRRLKIPADECGDWHLWIFCCHWCIRLDGMQLAWSEDSRELIGHISSRLNGLKLVAVDIDPERGASTFAFELGFTLETWPYEDDPHSEQWMFFSRTDVLTYRADGAFALGPSNTPDNQEQWHPLR